MRHSSEQRYWLAASSVLVVAIAIAAALAPSLLAADDRIGWEGRSVAAGSGVAISFWDYFRVGAPLTIVTLVIGTLWLWL
jgi:Na+/H+ antiporter NhaD/arsenite permease-like protein